MTPDAEKNPKRAVFLDRDGTINVEKEYLYRVEDFAFIPGVPQALRKLQDAGFLLVVVTNQSGVARGYYTLEDVDLLHRYMCAELKKYGVRIAGSYVCPHYTTSAIPSYAFDCACRKPKPGMLLQAAGELHIDLTQSYMVGDKASDVQAGQSAGCRSFLVQSGHEIEMTTAAELFPDLSAATEKILSLL